MSNLIVVGFSGPKGCGKSFNAEHVAEAARHLKLVVFFESFASPLKRMLAELGVPKPHLHDPDFKDSPLHYPFEGLTARRLMQTLGTEWGRNIISKSLWIDIMDNNVASLAIDGYDLVVIDDVRFRDEAEYVTSNGILICLSGRNGYTEEHQSEMPLDVSGLPNVFYSESVEQTLAHLKPLFSEQGKRS